jgi:hypothetical protein
VAVTPLHWHHPDARSVPLGMDAGDHHRPLAPQTLAVRPLAGFGLSAVRCCSARWGEGGFGVKARVSNAGQIMRACMCTRTCARELGTRDLSNGRKAMTWCGCTWASTSGLTTVASSVVERGVRARLGTTV